MIKKYKYIFLIFFALLLIDLFLVAYYFFPTVKFYLIRGYPLNIFRQSKGFSYDLYNSNSTDIGSKMFNLNPGEFIIIDSNPEISELGNVWLSGYIESTPFIEPTNGFVIVKIRFEGIKDPIIADTILGKDDFYISTLIANKGRVSNQLWTALKVFNVKSILKKGDPVIVNLYYSNNLTVLENKAGCDNNCINSWNVVVENYANTSNLLQHLGGKKVNLSGFVGPIKELIAYDQ